MLIHKYIEAHAVHQPDSLAVRFRQSKLTYAQLNQQVNQLAYYLNSLGIVSEDRVAVCLEPSLEVAVSLLAILKSGHIYVPLDPNYPLERLTTILTEIKPKVLITQSHLIPKLEALGEHIFCIDQNLQAIQSLPLENIENKIALNQTAYIIYTSGTTGIPKGVMVSHSNLLHYILTSRQTYGFHCQDVMPAIARFTFSISLFELLSPLVAGGTLLILDRDCILDFERMTQILEKVTVIHAGPSLLRSLLTYIEKKQLQPQKFQSLRHVSTGGDMIPVDILERMKKIFQYAEIFVIYGCSEASCMGCTYLVPQEGSIVKSLVGQPFKNVSIRLYDESQNLVPVGTAGEIYIGGSGVAQGYLYREELTQSMFVEMDGVRFYRTGDIGRYDGDGHLEVLGRSDFQVKLRGIRIELNEIETILRQAPGVQNGVVTSCKLGSREKGLVAYVVLEPGKEFIVEVRHFLQKKLPDYMLPTIFMELDALPLTPNGKLDRRALPVPDTTNIQLGNNFVVPRNLREQIIADIWIDVLGVKKIGIYDNFFRLGGSSLLATQLISRCNQIFSCEITFRCLFSNPTIEGFAMAVSQSLIETENAYLSSMLAELERVSDEEAKELLSKEMQSTFHGKHSILK